MYDPLTPVDDYERDEGPPVKHEPTEFVVCPTCAGQAKGCSLCAGTAKITWAEYLCWLEESEPQELPF